MGTYAITHLLTYMLVEHPRIVVIAAALIVVGFVIKLWWDTRKL